MDAGNGQLPRPEALGPRIMVLGPTNSGKSTLTEALGMRLGVPAIHLDRLRHIPGTDWEQRPDAEFAALHDAAVAEPAWIMDGSYSVLMPQRVARATGIIVLDENLAVRTLRYLRRSLSRRRRAGGLEGDRDSVKWEMLAWLWKTRNKAEGTRQSAIQTGLPHVFCRSTRELKVLYAAWGLSQADL
tara:strand:- start:410 stop:967 length:558 start_codon:yes stop_codon:yes gene_type:complete